MGRLFYYFISRRRQRPGNCQPAIQRQDEALQYFIGTYSDMAMTVAISLIKDPRLAGEIVQDALMAAWKIVPYFKDRSSFRAALYRLVMKEACIKLKGNRHGKGSWDRNMDENILIENAFLSLKRSEQITFIREALKKIPPHEPLMLRLFNLQERGNTTIGSLNPGAAHSYHKKRAGNLAMPASL